MIRRSPQSGFAMVEALIAMALLAIAAVSFLRATAANVRRVAKLEVRASAGWVALNRLAELTLGLQPADGPVQMKGGDFVVVVIASPTTDDELRQMDITVAEVDVGAASRLTGFVAVMAEAGQ